MAYGLIVMEYVSHTWKNAIKPERFPALELTKLAKLVMSFRFGFGMIQKDLNGLGFNFGTKRRIKVRN